MTVSYSRLVANGSSFGCFWSILRKWKGSVYKLVWRELIAYMVLYFAINMAYRYAMTEPQQRFFEKFRNYFKGRSQNIPMSFVLGFYVTLVVRRWWEQYRLLPWPDTLALFVSAAIPGADERGRLMRRTIVRYAVLAYVITLKHVSVRVKKRFPTLQHIVDADFYLKNLFITPQGLVFHPNSNENTSLSSFSSRCILHNYHLGLMMESEKKIFVLLEEKTTMTKYWLPLTWATNIINRARRDSLITSDHMVQTILLEMSDIRMRLGSLIGYDNVNIPIVYTQVVTLSVYTYFLAALIGAQMIPPLPDSLAINKPEDVDLYFPIITVLEFCFYIGWLKVAEVLIGPFGEDDDDIELNWLIDRHIKAAYMIVDEMHEEHPELLKDQYWDEVVPKDLPYTVASEHYRKQEPKGSAEFYKVKESDALYANVGNSSRRKSVLPDDVYADYESVDTPVAERRSKNNNWFQRQITRMGSMRSSSTTYSSGGLLGRTRLNSVYSSPENGIPVTTGGGAASNNHLSHKMSLYDRLVGRKSNRGIKTRQTGNTKLNGAVPMNFKNRPRIPTPDVSKDSAAFDNTIHYITQHNNGTVAYTTAQPNSQTLIYSSATEIPVVQVLLSPIQEQEAVFSSVNNSNVSVGNGTSALAQAVLPPTLKSLGIESVSLNSSMLPTAAVSMAVSPITLSTVSMSQPFFATMGINSRNSPIATATPVILTDVTHLNFDKDDASPTASLGSNASSTATNSTTNSSSASSSNNTIEDKFRRTTPPKRGEVYV